MDAVAIIEHLERRAELWTEHLCLAVLLVISRVEFTALRDNEVLLEPQLRLGGSLFRWDKALQSCEIERLDYLGSK